MEGGFSRLCQTFCLSVSEQCVFVRGCVCVCACMRVRAHMPTYTNLQHLFVSLSLCEKQKQLIASSMFDLEAPHSGRAALLQPADATDPVI